MRASAMMIVKMLTRSWFWPTMKKYHSLGVLETSSSWRSVQTMRWDERNILNLNQLFLDQSRDEFDRQWKKNILQRQLPQQWRHGAVQSVKQANVEVSIHWFISARSAWHLLQLQEEKVVNITSIFLPSKSLFSERIQNLSWVKVLTVLRLSWSQTPGLVTSWPTLMKECSSWMWSWLLLLMMPILSPVLEMENMLLASERFDALNKHHFIVTFMIQMSLAIPESNGLEEQSVVIFTSNNIKPSDSAVFSYDIGNNTESTTPPPTTSTTPYISPDEVLLMFIRKYLMKNYFRKFLFIFLLLRRNHSLMIIIKISKHEHGTL